MTLNDLLLIGSFLISVSAAILAISKRQSEIKLNEASEAEKISAAWERLNRPNEQRIQDLESRLKAAMSTIEDLQKKLVLATARITELEAENAELKKINSQKNTPE